MANTVLRDLRDSTFTIQDNGGTNSLAVKIGSGNISYTERKEREYRLDRRVLDTVRAGEDVPLEVSFEFEYAYIKGKSGTGEPATVEEALKQTGNAAAWVSTDANSCAPYAVDIVVEFDPSACSAEEKETVTFPDFRHEELSYDTSEGQVSCRGRCNATEPTAVRAA
jgi:hypothetical protein